MRDQCVNCGRETYYATAETVRDPLGQDGTLRHVPGNTTDSRGVVRCDGGHYARNYTGPVATRAGDRS